MILITKHLPGFKLAIFKLAIFLALFPEIGLIRLPSDAQPYFFLVALVGIIINLNKRSVYPTLLIPFFIILIISLVSFILTIYTSDDLFTLLRSLFGYISSFVFLFFLFRYNNYFKEIVIVPILDFSVKFIYVGFFLNLIGLNKIVQLLINRSEFRFDGARGLVSFYSEQSNMVTACFVIIFLYLHFKQLSLKRAVFVILAIILSASGQAFIEIILVSAFYFISYFTYILVAQKISKSILKYSFLFISFLLLLAYGVQNFDFDFRAFKIFKNFNLESGLYILGSDYSISWKVQGVFLAISTIIADPFIFQISSLTETDAYSRLIYAQKSVYEYVFGVSNPQFGDRVYSAFGTWIVDFGIIGLVMYLVFVLLFIRNVFKNNSFNPIVFTSILYVLYVTLIKVGLSTPTIFLVVFSTYTISISPKSDLFNSNF